MRRLFLLLPLLLAACAETPAAPLAGVWVGRSEADLVASLGVPTRVHEAEGRRFLAYDGNGAAHPVVVPSLGFGVGRSSGSWGSATGIGTGLGLSFGPFGQTGPCTTSYEVQDGRVVAASRQGPGCG
jgi:hypothetical protein